MECYLCKSQNNIRLEGKLRDLPHIPILKCTNCGLVFLASTEHIKDNYYEESRMMLDEGFDIEKWVAEVDKETEARIEWLKPIVKGKSILDFGCGSGSILRELKKYGGWNVGIEKSKELRKIIKEKYNIPVLEDIKFISSETEFDIVTMFHVLEHLKDPKTTLISLSKLLYPDGSILIETPNANDALISLYKNKPFSEFTYWSCHLYLFNTYTLRKLIEDSGLEVEYIKQVQRYPLSNHLYWLAKGKPNGHNIWNFINNKELNKQYESQLASLGVTDTLLASVKLKNEK